MDLGEEVIGDVRGLGKGRFVFPLGIIMVGGIPYPLNIVLFGSVQGCSDCGYSFHFVHWGSGVRSARG